MTNIINDEGIGVIAPTASPRPLVPSRKWLILLCVSVPSFMLNLDANIVAVSLPSIARALGADFAAIEWVVSAYTLAFASLLLPAGMVADRYGRKKVLLIGLAIFTAASFACGAAPVVGVLNGARALQGVGAALLLSGALATLSHEFRGAARARAFAFWGSVIGVAMTLGPIAGGLITHTLGWEWAFYLNVPIGLVMIVLTMYAVDESRDPQAAAVDVPGLLSFASALFFLTLALISGNHAGWGSRSVVIEFVAAAVLFAAFVVAEVRQPRPMLDLSFFRRPTYIGANLAGIAYAAALLTMLTFLPLYFQSGFDVEPQQAGLMMLPMAVPLFVVPRIVGGYLAHRLSGRALLALGLGLVSIGLFAMALIAADFDYGSMLVGMLVAGTGAGILNGEIAKIGMTVIPPERAGMAAGVGGTTRFAGLVVGFAALGAVLFARVAGALDVLLPDLQDGARQAIAQRIAAGDLHAAGLVSPGAEPLIRASFGAGYEAVFLTAAAVAALAAIASWALVRASETAPLREALGTAQPIHVAIE